MAKKKIYEVNAVDNVFKNTKKNEVFNVSSTLTENVTINSGKGSDIVYLQGVSSLDDLTFKKDETSKDLLITKENGQTITVKNYFSNLAGSATKSSVKKIRLDIGTNETGTAITKDYTILNESLINYDPVITKRSKKGLIKGTNFNDTIVGSTKADKIKGGKGDDIIYGGAGNDKLYGGAGADTFIFDTYSKENPVTGTTEYYGSGADKIYDATSVDTLQFTTSKVSDLTFTKSKKNLIIKYYDVDYENGKTTQNSVTLVNYYKQKAANRLTKIVALNQYGKLVEYNLNEVNSETFTDTNTEKPDDYAETITIGTTEGETDTTLSNTTNRDQLVFEKSTFKGCNFYKKGDDLLIEYKDETVENGDTGTVTVEDYFKEDGKTKIDAFVDMNGLTHSLTDANFEKYVNKVSGDENGSRMYAIDGEENVLNGKDGNDVYYSTLTAKTTINDTNGIDNLVIQGSDVSDIKFFFDVQKDENGVFLADSLYIVNPDDLAKADPTQFTGGIEIKDYFKNITIDPNGGAMAEYGHDEGYNVVNIPANASYEEYFGTNEKDALYTATSGQEISLSGGKGDDKIYVQFDNTSSYNYGTFFLNAGYGNDIIYGVEGFEIFDFDNIRFDEFIFTRSNNDLVINYTDNDSITLADYFIVNKDPYIRMSDNVDTTPVLSQHIHLLENYKNTGHIEFMGATVNGNNKVFDLTGLNKLYNDVIKFVDGTEFSSAHEVLENGTDGQKTTLFNLYKDYSVETKEYREINVWSDNANTFIGTEFDDDFRVYSSRGDKVVDIGGNDKVLIYWMIDANDYNVYFNVNSNITTGDDLCIVYKDYWSKYSEYSNNGITIENYFGEGKIESICGYIDSDCKTLSCTFDDSVLTTITSEVATWLTADGRSYDSSQAVFDSGNTDDIQAMLQVYQDAQAGIWK